jgi:hypothetical protein
MHKLLTGTIGAILLVSPLTYAQEQKPDNRSQDMKQAVEWERAKDRAAERQARIEARHPHSEQSADRRVTEQKETTGRKVKDTQAPGAKRDRPDR